MQQSHASPPGPELPWLLLLLYPYRNPLLHFSYALYRHITQDHGLPLILLLNKCDLIPPAAAASWQQWLQQQLPGVTVIPVSACEERASATAKQVLSVVLQQQVLRGGRQIAVQQWLQMSAGEHVLVLLFDFKHCITLHPYDAGFGVCKKLHALLCALVEILAVGGTPALRAADCSALLTAFLALLQMSSSKSLCGATHMPNDTWSPFSNSSSRSKARSVKLPTASSQHQQQQYLMLMMVMVLVVLMATVLMTGAPSPAGVCARQAARRGAAANIGTSSQHMTATIRPTSGSTPI